MKYSKNILLVVLAVAVILFTVTGCGDHLTDEQRFYKRYDEITVVEESLALIRVEEISKKCLEENQIVVKDMFITAAFEFGENNVWVHVLTEDGTYQLFKVYSKMSGPLVLAIQSGTAGNYDNDLKEYLDRVNPSLDISEKIIDFS